MAIEFSTQLLKRAHLTARTPLTAQCNRQFTSRYDRCALLGYFQRGCDVGNRGGINRSHSCRPQAPKDRQYDVARTSYVIDFARGGTDVGRAASALGKKHSITIQRDQRGRQVEPLDQSLCSHRPILGGGAAKSGCALGFESIRRECRGASID